MAGAAWQRSHASTSMSRFVCDWRHLAALFCNAAFAAHLPSMPEWASRAVCVVLNLDMLVVWYCDQS